MKTFVFLAMIFCHIIDDYNLQGWLASAKQKSWWKDNAPDNLYKYDYLCALLMHSMSWSFMIMLPVAAYYRFQIDEHAAYFIFYYIVNAVIHMYVDNLKANKKTINLWQDQIAHIAQIVWTYVSFFTGISLIK